MEHLNKNIEEGYKGFIEANADDVFNEDGEDYVRAWDENDTEYLAKRVIAQSTFGMRT